MDSFQQFLEAKKTQNTSHTDALMDAVKALQVVFKSQSLETRKFVWDRLTSKEGEKKVKELLRTPNRSLSYFRGLAH